MNAIVSKHTHTHTHTHTHIHIHTRKEKKWNWIKIKNKFHKFFKIHRYREQQSIAVFTGALQWLPETRAIVAFLKYRIARLIRKGVSGVQWVLELALGLAVDQPTLVQDVRARRDALEELGGALDLIIHNQMSGLTGLFCHKTAQTHCVTLKLSSLDRIQAGEHDTRYGDLRRLPTKASAILTLRTVPVHFFLILRLIRHLNNAIFVVYYHCRVISLKRQKETITSYLHQPERILSYNAQLIMNILIFDVLFCELIFFW